MENALRQVDDLCDLGFQYRDSGYYQRIIDVLTPHEEHGEVADIIRLAGAGQTLFSPRFAYPHIQDIARDLLAKMQNGEHSSCS